MDIFKKIFFSILIFAFFVSSNAFSEVVKKIEVTGKEATKAMDYICNNHVTGENNKVVYTCLL